MNWFNKLRKYRWALTGRAKIKKQIEENQKNNELLKIIIGAGHHSIPADGWINTDIPQFDVTSSDHWKSLFENVQIDSLFAEHVFEHLTLEQNKAAFKFIHMYLKPNGVFRFAVPDGYNPDKDYINYVRPGGNGPGCDDHKILWNIDMINDTFSNTGFTILPRENYSKEGVLFSSELNAEYGKVMRTVTNPDKQDWTIKNYSSLIVDFIKK